MLSDPDRTMGVAYGAATDVSTRSAKRISYLIGPDGTVIKVYGKVSARQHPHEVLADLGAALG